MTDGARPIELDLPMPPSVNAIWRHRRGGGVYLDNRYATWKRVCDNFLMAARPKPHRIHGPFTVSVTLSDKQRRGDADNRLKALLDWLQRVELIDNDSKAERVTIGWGYAPEGCHVTVTPVVQTRAYWEHAA